MKEPGPDHPITITPFDRHVRVIVGEIAIADTRHALELKEAGYPPALYAPREDVDWKAFSRSERSSYCPYKGLASYFDLSVGGRTRLDAAWSYETPYPAMARIKGHLAFFPDKVDAIEID